MLGRVLLHLLREGIPFLVRAKKNVLVYYQGKAKALGRFPVKTGQIQCYSVLYHSKQKIPLNLIIFRGKGYKETWYLLIPKEIPLPPKEVVYLYARRMSIEQGFRDWKTHLGVRGLVFYCEDPAPRLTRLLLGFSLAYLLCLALGASGEAESVRAFVEIPRRKPRHGTRRTLSSLSIGILRFSLPRFANLAHKDLFALLRLLSSGKGLISLCPLPPYKNLPKLTPFSATNGGSYSLNNCSCRSNPSSLAILNKNLLQLGLVMPPNPSKSEGGQGQFPL